MVGRRDFDEIVERRFPFPPGCRSWLLLAGWPEGLWWLGRQHVLLRLRRHCYVQPQRGRVDHVGSGNVYLVDSVCVCGVCVEVRRRAGGLSHLYNKGA